MFRKQFPLPSGNNPPIYNTAQKESTPISAAKSERSLFISRFQICTASLIFSTTLTDAFLHPTQLSQKSENSGIDVHPQSGTDSIKAAITGNIFTANVAIRSYIQCVNLGFTR